MLTPLDGFPKCWLWIVLQFTVNHSVGECESDSLLGLQAGEMDLLCIICRLVLCAEWERCWATGLPKIFFCKLEVAAFKWGENTMQFYNNSIFFFFF